MLRKTLVVAIASVLAVSRSIIHTAKALDEAEKQAEPHQEEQALGSEQKDANAADQQTTSEAKSRWNEFMQEVLKKKEELAKSRFIKIAINVALHIATFFVVDAVCSGIRYLF